MKEMPSTWNLRVIHHSKEYILNWVAYLAEWESIHEVYYDEDDNILSWTEDAIDLTWDCGCSEEFLTKVKEALTKPILVITEDGKQLKEINQ